jgi:hypothetical protein
VFSLVNRPKEPRRPDDPYRAARRVILLSHFPGAGFITGYYRKMGLVAIYQAVNGVGARKRKERSKNTKTFLTRAGIVRDVR